MLEAEDALLSAMASLRFRAVDEGCADGKGAGDALLNVVTSLTFTATNEG